MKPFTFIVMVGSAISVFSQSPTPSRGITGPVNQRTSAGKPTQISGGILNGKALSLPKPQYPATAIGKKAAGAVSVQVYIDQSGDVILATAVSGHPLLRAASESAARSAKFGPTLLNGVPVNVSGVITYDFVLPASGKDNEEMTAMMGLGTVLSLSRFIELDSDWGPVVREASANLPNLTDEFEQIKKLNNDTPIEQRERVLNSVLTSIQKKLTGADAWQFEVGRHFGLLLAGLREAPIRRENPLTESDIRSALSRIKELLKAVPDDFPPDVTAKLKVLAEFAQQDDLSSEGVRTKMVDAFTKTLAVISPGP